MRPARSVDLGVRLWRTALFCAGIICQLESILNELVRADASMSPVLKRIEGRSPTTAHRSASSVFRRTRSASARRQFRRDHRDEAHGQIDHPSAATLPRPFRMLVMPMSGYGAKSACRPGGRGHSRRPRDYRRRVRARRLSHLLGEYRALGGCNVRKPSFCGSQVPLRTGTLRIRGRAFRYIGRS